MDPFHNDISELRSLAGASAARAAAGVRDLQTLRRIRRGQDVAPLVARDVLLQPRGQLSWGTAASLLIILVGMTV